jgi:saccharopepsin
MRALGQKYMGIRPERISEEMFKAQDVVTDGGHPVPVSVCLFLQAGAYFILS